jgi:hypothetical protein
MFIRIYKRRILCEEKGMLKEIWKYNVPVEEYFDIEMPKKSKVLSFQMQGNKPTIWVLTSHEDKELTNEHFCLVGTGQSFLPHYNKHIGTIQKNGYVWHLFQATIE